MDNNFYHFNNRLLNFKVFVIVSGIIMAGNRFSKLFKQPNIPDRTVEEVLAEKDANILKRNMEKEQFLADMSAIESSSGQNTDHKMMTGGIHAGERAVGDLGLMPNTINEMSNRLRREGKEPYELNNLRITGASDQEIANRVSENPELQSVISDKLYDHVDKKYAGDKEKMNLAWFLGHNSSPTKIAEKIESHPRTEKFRQLRKKLASK